MLRLVIRTVTGRPSTAGMRDMRASLISHRVTPTMYLAQATAFNACSIPTRSFPSYSAHPPGIFQPALEAIGIIIRGRSFARSRSPSFASFGLWSSLARR